MQRERDGKARRDDAGNSKQSVALRERQRKYARGDSRRHVAEQRNRQDQHKSKYKKHNADQARADVLIGFEPASRLLFMAEARTQVSLGNERAGGDDFDVVKTRASIVWRASRKWRIVAGAEKEFFARGVTPGTAVILGMWSEF